MSKMQAATATTARQRYLGTWVRLEPCMETPDGWGTEWDVMYWVLGSLTPFSSRSASVSDFGEMQLPAVARQAVTRPQGARAQGTGSLAPYVRMRSPVGSRPEPSLGRRGVSRLRHAETRQPACIPAAQTATVAGLRERRCREEAPPTRTPLSLPRNGAGEARGQRRGSGL